VEVVVVGAIVVVVVGVTVGATRATTVVVVLRPDNIEVGTVVSVDPGFVTVVTSGAVVVGAVTAAAVVKFRAVDDEIPAYTLFAASLNAPESTVT
jgi:hypothetical protein